MALMENIRTHLSDQGVSGVNWPCYIGLAPDDVDQVIQLIETGGYSESTHSGVEHPTFQVTVRAERYQYSTCRTKWGAIYSVLNDAGPTGSSPDPLEDYALIRAVASGPLAFHDDNLRPVMTMNLEVVKL